MQYDDFQKCAKLKCQSVHETYSIFLFRKDIVIKYTIKVFNGIDTCKIIIKNLCYVPIFNETIIYPNVHNNSMEEIYYISCHT